MIPIERQKSLVVWFVVIVVLMLLIACSFSDLGSQQNISPVQLTELAEYQMLKTSTAIAANVETDIAARRPPDQPTYTPYPTYTFPPQQPVPTQQHASSPQIILTATPWPETTIPLVPSQSPADVAVRIEKTSAEFFCNYDPRSVTFYLYVSDINATGFAMYYRFKEISSGQTTSKVKVDIHRDNSETYRYVTLIGNPSIAPDYHSTNVYLPSGMGPSYLVYEIISDDGGYRTTKIDDVIYYPCGYYIDD